MGLAEITIAKPLDRESLIQTAVLSFVTDPMARWISDRAATFFEATKSFFDAFGGRAFEKGTAWTANNGQAVAMWLPPGTEPDGDRMVGILKEYASAERLEEMMVVLGQMEHFHPQEEHWYLPIIGCDPMYLGMGLGSLLMKTALERVDADGLPAYLESSNPRNVSLYERHGFEVIGEIQHGSSPVMLPMYRSAR
ncbi:MAG: GNAT family N-acetyltransferase [Alphaproteobacteria bacterium HGW-Alphaproteobacteria-15]|nr:MAG: GNAT family N-acetyltransferase [Alphaproteobacteria bacterium HGW-Alphaproteobacteria-15]